MAHGIPEFWHYMGTFIAYTLLAIGFIYGAFFFLKQNPRLLSILTQRPQGHLNPAQKALAIETCLPLEAKKSLYIIASGNERFLIATSQDGTQFLSRLEDTPAAAQATPAIETSNSSPLQTVQSSQKEAPSMSPEPSLMEKISRQGQQNSTLTSLLNVMQSPLTARQFSLLSLKRVMQKRFENLQYQLEKTSTRNW